MSALDSWREEKQSAWLYRELAGCEPDPRVAGLFRSLANAADGQAERWRAEMQGSPPGFAPSVRARITARLARLLGPRRIRPMLAAMKVRGISVYDARSTTPGHLMPTSVAQVGVRHKGYGGGHLRAAVADVGHQRARGAVEVAPTVGVPQVAPFAADCRRICLARRPREDRLNAHAGRRPFVF